MLQASALAAAEARVSAMSAEASRLQALANRLESDLLRATTPGGGNTATQLAMGASRSGSIPACTIHGSGPGLLHGSGSLGSVMGATSEGKPGAGGMGCSPGPDAVSAPPSGLLEAGVEVPGCEAGAGALPGQAVGLQLQRGATSSSGPGQRVESSEDLDGSMEGAGDAGMSAILLQQRDRFKQRVSQLEEEAGACPGFVFRRG
jgi:hypothetical protein